MKRARARLPGPGKLLAGEGHFERASNQIAHIGQRVSSSVVRAGWPLELISRGELLALCCSAARVKI